MSTDVNQLLALHCVHSIRTGIYVTLGCPSVRPSVCLSVCAAIRPQQRRAAGLLLSAVQQEISIDGGECSAAATAPQHGAQQQTRAVARR